MYMNIYVMGTKSRWSRNIARWIYGIIFFFFYPNIIYLIKIIFYNIYIIFLSKKNDFIQIIFLFRIELIKSRYQIFDIFIKNIYLIPFL